MHSLNEAGNWSVIRMWKVKLITNVFHEAVAASNGMTNIIIVFFINYLYKDAKNFSDCRTTCDKMNVIFMYLTYNLYILLHVHSSLGNVLVNKFPRR
jgi:hypothetical protein